MKNSTQFSPVISLSSFNGGFKVDGEMVNDGTMVSDAIDINGGGYLSLILN